MPKLWMHPTWRLRKRVARLCEPNVVEHLEVVRRRDPAAWEVLAREAVAAAELRLEAAVRYRQGEDPPGLLSLFATGRCAECEETFLGRSGQRYCSERCGNRNRNRGRAHVGGGRSAAENSRRRIEKRIRAHYESCRRCQRGDYCPQAESLLTADDALPQRHPDLTPEDAEVLPHRLRSRGHGPSWTEKPRPRWTVRR